MFNLFGLLFTLPNATTVLTEAGSWAGPLLTEFLPIIYIMIGVAVMVIILKLVFGLGR